MSEVIEMDATPIETGIEPMSGLDVLVGDITTEAERLAREYAPREIASEEDFKQSKRERAGARKDIAALRQRYQESMRAIKDAVSQADARAKAALAPLDAVDAGYKREVDAYEERWKLDRISMLAQEYQEFAPDLVPLVPFERLMARFGLERGRQWDARSMSDAQAIAAMQQAVETVAADERLIATSPYDDADKVTLRAEFFRTLDVSKVLREMAERKEAERRTAELDRQRRERECVVPPLPKVDHSQPIDIDTRPVMTPADIADELEAVGTPQKTPAPITGHQSIVRAVSGAQTVLVALYAATPTHMGQLKATLAKLGIHGQPCSTGVLLSEEQCSDLLTYAKTRALGYGAPKAR